MVVIIGHLRLLSLLLVTQLTLSRFLSHSLSLKWSMFFVTACKHKSIMWNMEIFHISIILIAMSMNAFYVFSVSSCPNIFCVSLNFNIINQNYTLRIFKHMWICCYKFSKHGISKLYCVKCGTQRKSHSQCYSRTNTQVLQAIPLNSCIFFLKFRV